MCFLSDFLEFFSMIEFLLNYITLTTTQVNRRADTSGSTPSFLRGDHKEQPPHCCPPDPNQRLRKLLCLIARQTETEVMGASLRSRQEFALADTNSFCLFSPSFLSPKALGCYCPPCSREGNGHKWPVK